MLRFPVVGAWLVLLFGVGRPGQTGRDVEAEQRNAFLRQFAGMTRDSAGMGTLLYAPPANRTDKTRGHLPPKHPAFFPADSGPNDSDVVMARMLIPGGGTHHYFVVQTDGPSGDPGFYFIDEVTGKETETIPADILVIPVAGQLQVFQRSDSHFAKRARWQFDHGSLRELAPSSYQIGLATATTGPVVVTAKPDGGPVVARLQKGDSLDVLSTDDRPHQDKVAFRVRTRRTGQLGWVLIRSTQCPTALIIGLCWQGD